ncbi:glycerophosphodiester phosphodiesterase GDPD1, chloroplastic-like [Aristolochia californica]|uniref:glycerophosphodiester phosphodiesterase GDPD1, chloroplastic-like n=1 Tax=Aristolochia californica TaxID=171875 RepID=UPI0035D6CC3C
MALKAVHVSDVLTLDQVLENAALSLSSSKSYSGVEGVRTTFKSPKFLVIGHRGSGMNMLYSPDRRMKAIKENSISSFNGAGKFAVDFVEFDVQVTKDDCPVIFHDNFILAEEEDGSMSEKRVTELTLEELFQYGPQREPGKVGKPLMRKTKDGRVLSWKVEDDDSLCTLQEAFEKVDHSLGFNIELKFDDNVFYADDELVHALRAILEVVFKYAQDRLIIFSSFQPDAVRLVRKLQSVYPVFFLTNGGSEIYTDVRRNSLDEALNLCLANGLQGIVSEAKGIFRNPGAISRIKEANLGLLTFGHLNNVPEAVYMQHLMGVDGVIVDLVKEISEAVLELIKPGEEGEECLQGSEIELIKPKFSKKELSFLLKLIPEFIQLRG